MGDHKQDASELHLRTLMTIAVADGEVHAEETRVIAEVAVRLGCEVEATSLKPSSLSRSVRGLEGAQRRQEVLEDAMRVASADGVIHGDELRCIKFLCEAWSLPTPEVSGVDWGKVMGMDPVDSGERASTAGMESPPRRSDASKSAAFRAVRRGAEAPSEDTLRLVRLILVGLAGLGLASLLEATTTNLLPSEAVLRPSDLQLMGRSSDMSVMERQLSSGVRLISIGGAYWAYIPALCCLVSLCVVSVLGGAGGLGRVDGGVAAVLAMLGYAGPRLQGVVSQSSSENAMVLVMGLSITIGSFGIGWLGSSVATRGMPPS